MAKRIVKAGTGLTATTATLHDEPLTRGIFRGGRPTFDGEIARWERICEAVIAEPDRFDRITDDPGLEYLDDRPSVIAFRILKMLACARTQVEQGNADSAARYAFNAGQDITALSMKIVREQDYLRGVAILNNASVGGKERAKQHAAKTKAVLRAMARLVDEGHSISNAARLAHKEGFGTNPEANRKLWNNHSEK